MKVVSAPALFIDRDGVLNVDTGYPYRIEDLELYSDLAALRLVQEAGFCLIVVTNQSGVGRGYCSLAQVELFNQHLCSRLRRFGVQLNKDDFYICPHHPEAGCDCRKPKPALFQRAARERDLDLSRSFAVGNSPSDLEAASSAGVRAFLIDRSRSSQANAVASLSELSDLLLADPRDVRGATSVVANGPASASIAGVKRRQ